MIDSDTNAAFPAGLLDWSGHRAGGVRRLFHESGRPAGQVIRTTLLTRLSDWAKALGANTPGTPRAVLLVGGPGNGKTEAIESAIRDLDGCFGLEGRLSQNLETVFGQTDGKVPARLVSIDLASLTRGKQSQEIAIVQDASVIDEDDSRGTPAAALVHDLERLVLGDSNSIYLACVNRGVLDDALIDSIESERTEAQALLETIVKSAGLGPKAPSCWPLDGFPAIAVWPMDVESLVESREPDKNVLSPAGQLLRIATNEASWPVADTCAAGIRCPFCISRMQLSGEPHQGSLLRILRWYELASGKRWNFRDLQSLISFLFAGVPAGHSDSQRNPCEWAAEVLDVSGRGTQKKESLRLSAPFVLVSCQYQHALFGSWPREIARLLRQDLEDLQLLDHPTLLGLYYFLQRKRSPSVPATLESQLDAMCTTLDPALADPDIPVELSARTTVSFREIDTRFSQSIAEGLRFIRKYKCLSVLETELLQRLEEAEGAVSALAGTSKKSSATARVKRLLRDFSCRFVRRSVGTRSAVVRDSQVLSDFQRVVDGDGPLLHDAVKRVEGLLNENEHFAVSLNTTFGEPLPPEERRATLVTAKQRVRPREAKTGEGPVSTIRYLAIGASSTAQFIPLTYELFRAARELSYGMVPASLPRPVVALLDATRARLSGMIVRDEELLDGAEIFLGLRDDVIIRELGSFVIRRGGEAR